MIRYHINGINDSIYYVLLLVFKQEFTRRIHNKEEKKLLKYWNKLVNEENARIVWLCGGISHEIEDTKRGKIIGNFDEYRAKFNRFQKWKGLHNVSDVPDHLFNFITHKIKN